MKSAASGTVELTVPPSVELFVVDRATHVAIQRAEVFLTAEVVSEVMGRPPAVRRLDLVSWGGVTAAELEALLRSEGDGCAHEEALALASEHPPGRAFWSLVIMRGGR